jgi:hypothetical protein
MAYMPHPHDEHQQRPRVTTDHSEIRQWVEQNGGQPARVRGNIDEDSVGLLRIQVPGSRHREPLETISWDEFFRKFDSHDLALLYRHGSKDGEKTAFHQLVHRGNLHSPSA